MFTHSTSHAGGDRARVAPERAPAGFARPPRGAQLIQRCMGNEVAQQFLSMSGTDTLHRCGPVPCDCSPAERLAAESNGGLTVSHPNDPAELEAERVATDVMRMADGEPDEVPVATHEDGVLARHAEAGDDGHQPVEAGIADRIEQTIQSGGQPLGAGVRRFMEARFGRDLGAVQLHTDPQSAGLATRVRARAFTMGDHVFFAPGQYQPDSGAGRRLIAHELTHVMQQRPSPPARLQRQSASDMDMAAERQFGGTGAPKAKTCGSPPWCPGGFCKPFSSEELAKYYRQKWAPWLMAGIAGAVNGRVVPLWREYLWGGSPPKDLTAEFGADFTASPTTLKTTAYLYEGIKTALSRTVPFVPRGAGISIAIETLIPSQLAALRIPGDVNEMNFSIPRDIPGNLAGGIGDDETACPSGAQPSPFNDDRRAHGTVELSRGIGPDVTVTPSIGYTVQDTIDLCPGDCGSVLEQVATVPLSQFEATGIAGDIPFTVNFPAPKLASFTVRAPEGPDPLPAK